MEISNYITISSKEREILKKDSDHKIYLINKENIYILQKLFPFE